MTIDDYDYAGNLISLRRKGADGWETEIACQYDAMRRRIVWKNSQGGAYRSGTFKYNMLKYCERQQYVDYMPEKIAEKSYLFYRRKEDR